MYETNFIYFYYNAVQGREGADDTHPMNQSTVSRRYSGSRSSLTVSLRAHNEQNNITAIRSTPTAI